eukprot:COSAG02_NODE_3684_length_6385_cov_4.179287_4_plen_355_part_00
MHRTREAEQQAAEALIDQSARELLHTLSKDAGKDSKETEALLMTSTERRHPECDVVDVQMSSTSVDLLPVDANESRQEPESESEPRIETTQEQTHESQREEPHARTAAASAQIDNEDRATQSKHRKLQAAKQTALHEINAAAHRAKLMELSVEKKILVSKHRAENNSVVVLLHSLACACFEEAYGDTRQHGIVTFTSLRAATVARQVLHDSHGLDCMLNVQEAPDPNDFEVRNIGMGWNERAVRRTVGTVMDVTLLALWSLPVVAITSLTTPASLQELAPVLFDRIVSNSYVRGFMEGTLPSIILTRSLNLLPSILHATSVYQGAATCSEIDRQTIFKCEPNVANHLLIRLQLH